MKQNVLKAFEWEWKWLCAMRKCLSRWFVQLVFTFSLCNVRPDQRFFFFFLSIAPFQPRDFFSFIQDFEKPWPRKTFLLKLPGWCIWLALCFLYQSLDMFRCDFCFILLSILRCVLCITPYKSEDEVKALGWWNVIQRFILASDCLSSNSWHLIWCCNNPFLYAIKMVSAERPSSPSHHCYLIRNSAKHSLNTKLSPEKIPSRVVGLFRLSIIQKKKTFSYIALQPDEKD